MNDLNRLSECSLEEFLKEPLDTFHIPEYLQSQINLHIVAWREIYEDMFETAFGFRIFWNEDAHFGVEDADNALKRIRESKF